MLGMSAEYESVLNICSLLVQQDGDISAREEALRKREAELVKREERIAAAEATLGVRA